MKPLGEVIRRCGLRNHQYADDTQLYLSFSTNPGEAVAVLNRCLAEVREWMRANKLKLNPDKTEVLLVGGSGFGEGGFDLVLNGATLPLRDKVRSLGVLLDPELSLEAQVTAVARNAFLQLRLINQLCPYLEYDCLVTVTHALVTSRLDFCNALYVGLPLKTVRTLQLVQNRAARLLTGTGRYAHMTPVLHQLHWLPIEARAQFKVLIMTYKALNGLGPGYLNERLRPYMPDRPLRSAGESLLREPSMKEIRRSLQESFRIHPAPGADPHYLEYDSLATVTHALVTSRLDFCNALYVGLPLKTVRILQLVQNRAARLLTGTGRYAHMTPVLRQLHWLPIEVRAQFKVLVMTYKALNGLGPGYLKERLRPYMPSRPLRSAGEALLREPSVKEIRRVATRRRAFSAHLHKRLKDNKRKTMLFHHYGTLHLETWKITPERGTGLSSMPGATWRDWESDHLQCLRKHKLGSFTMVLPLGFCGPVGRLADPTDATTCGHKDGDNLCISVQSWWACMNYYLAVIPFLGALDSGILGELPYEIEILPPDGHRADFCHSIAECRAQAPNVMSAWRDFFKYQMSAAQNSDISAPHLLSEDDALKHMWEAHVYSIVFALPKFQNRLPFLSSSESSFGVAWATAVHFIAATRFPTDQNTTNHFQTGLPPRMLQEGDKAPFIPDFTPVQNRMVYMIETLHKANEKSGQPWINPRKEKFQKKTERLIVCGQIHLLSLLMRLVYQYAQYVVRNWQTTKSRMVQDISRINTQPLLKNIRMEMRGKKVILELMRKVDLSKNYLKKWIKSANSTAYASFAAALRK
ncbi:hypothetical protein EYD10_00580 [Varanus komodoensis]|nr:hypothetical protein EYD10_00580 [Varanus komodoensis]